VLSLSLSLRVNPLPSRREIDAVIGPRRLIEILSPAAEDEQ
jgi:hypothetical protein